MIWQPIETAPEGVHHEILIFCPGVGQIIVQKLKETDPEWQGDTWHTTWDKTPIWGDVTHWAPLPDDPKGAT
jgi:hypothetical protein